MKKYELLFVIDAGLENDVITETVEKFTTLIKNNGTIVEVNNWGKKRLAYEIQKMKEGFYYFIQFEAESSAPAEIESRIRIMDNVLRYLVVKNETK